MHTNDTNHAGRLALTQADQEIIDARSQLAQVMKEHGILKTELHSQADVFEMSDTGLRKEILVLKTQLEEEKNVRKTLERGHKKVKADFDLKAKEFEERGGRELALQRSIAQMQEQIGNLEVTEKKGEIYPTSC